MGYCLTKAKLSQGFSVAKHHCLANNNSQINLFVWDPTEPVATRPLFTQCGTGYKFFYTFDGNKNVSELVLILRTIVCLVTIVMILLL